MRVQERELPMMRRPRMTKPGFTAEASLTRLDSDDWWSRGPVTKRESAPLGWSGPRFSDRSAQIVPASVISGKVYGKWCGEGFGSGVPQDKVDQVCCRHDKCYCARGSLDCSCDRDLLESMPRAMADPTTPAAGRAAGALIMGIFASDPFCLCHRVCYPSIPDFWNLDCTRAPFPVPGLPPLKTCPPPYV